jgi:sterol-4alpha-carboxylate 3-dehydrogenase (decarboxylating)
MWKLAGHVPPYLIRLPEAVGLLLGTLAESWAKISGKEAGFTRFRVTFATQKRFYDVERARRLLGYKPIVGVEEGLKKTVEVSQISDRECRLISQWWLNEKSKSAISEKS